MAQTNTLKKSILELLMLSKYTKRKNLLFNLMANGHNVADRVLRATLEEMVTKDHYCIGSCEKGYYLIVGESDLTEAMHALRSKAEALSIRANSLLRNWKEGKLQEQYPLFV